MIVACLTSSFWDGVEDMGAVFSHRLEGEFVEQRIMSLEMV
jgi:hypothetical protein